MTPEAFAYFLDVGQGDCSLIIAPSGDKILVDCADVTVALNVLKDSGICELAAVVVSHLDLDHIRGMQRFLTTFLKNGGTIGRLFIDLDRPDILKNATGLLELAIRLEREKKLRLGSAKRDVILEGSGWLIEFLSPLHGTRIDTSLRKREAPNLLSAVVRLQYAGQSVIIAGDAPLGAWELIDPLERAARVFRAPHHGGDIGEGAKTLTIDQFYLELAPDVSVFSVGTLNDYPHPTAEHVRAAKSGRSCRRLCTQLTKQCHNDPDLKLKIARLNTSKVGYDYRHHRKRSRPEVPCAGTVIVKIDHSGSINVVPNAGDWHDDFVKSLDRPLCLVP